MGEVSSWSYPSIFIPFIIRFYISKGGIMISKKANAILLKKQRSFCPSLHPARSLLVGMRGEVNPNKQKQRREE
jgi:hypothetical protein